MDVKGDWVREDYLANAPGVLLAWELMKGQRVFPWLRGHSQVPFRVFLQV